jgi:hypothetical protein
MIAGLEFLKSRRFWIPLFAVSMAVALGSASVHIVLNLYFPAIAANEFSSHLGGIAVVMLYAVVLWFFPWRTAQRVRYPEEYTWRLMLAGGFSAILVSALVFAAVHWLLVEPILPTATVRTSYHHPGGLFVLLFGWWIAGREWAATSGADGGVGNSVSPDSP